MKKFALNAEAVANASLVNANPNKIDPSEIKEIRTKAYPLNKEPTVPP